jgi:hypothetical protein
LLAIVTGYGLLRDSVSSMASRQELEKFWREQEAKKVIILMTEKDLLKIEAGLEFVTDEEINGYAVDENTASFARKIMPKLIAEIRERESRRISLENAYAELASQMQEVDPLQEVVLVDEIRTARYPDDAKGSFKVDL